MGVIISVAIAVAAASLFGLFAQYGSPSGSDGSESLLIYSPNCPPSLSETTSESIWNNNIPGRASSNMNKSLRERDYLADFNGDGDADDIIPKSLSDRGGLIVFGDESRVVYGSHMSIWGPLPVVGEYYDISINHDRQCWTALKR